MIKIVIADDEERICKLICALIDLEALDAEIAGIGHNGMEALELVKLHEPQILITDIRMPGKSGLELIEEVKSMNPELEIVIISGYAHFDYAKNAMKLGVGDYLLKPINKQELNNTLKKLKGKILERTTEKESTQKLLWKSQKDVIRLQKILVEHLVELKEKDLSFEKLQNEYGLLVQPGLFQIFWLKADEYENEFSKAGLKIVMDKAEDLVESMLRPRCLELLTGQKEASCVGVMNYEPKKQEEIRRVLKDCLNQLMSRREIFGSVHFSMAVGTPVKEPEKIPESVKETCMILNERLVKGSGRLLERIQEPSSLNEQNFLEKYLRKIKHAIETMDEEEADRIVKELQAGVMTVKNVHGYEILDLIYACGNLFLSQIELTDRAEKERNFREKCSQCSCAEGLFEQLGMVQKQLIRQIKEQHESEEQRPIRLAKQYIQKHYHEQITLEEVSSVVGLSSAYFSVQFKKAEGEGFAKYLINVRMEQAKILLRESNDSVSEICRKVGYNDQKHFTHTFEKAAGVKPAVYRKLYG